MLAAVGVPPSSCRGRGCRVGRESEDGGAAHCVPVNNGASLPRQPTLPPEVLLAAEPLTAIPSGCLHTAELLTPVPSACLHSANCRSHPGSALLTPRFRTQPLPALADSCLRLGRPGLIPEAALVGAALRIDQGQALYQSVDEQPQTVLLLPTLSHRNVCFSVTPGPGRVLVQTPRETQNYWQESPDLKLPCGLRDRSVVIQVDRVPLCLSGERRLGS